MKKRLKVVLAEKNLTAKRLSEMTNISQSEMKFSTLVKICRALSIEFEDLFEK